MEKVLHIMSGFGGGISSFILNKAKEFSYRPISFDVLTYGECTEEFINVIEETGGRVIQMPNPKENGLGSFYSAVNETMKNLSKNTLIHCHIQGYRSLPFRIIAAKNGLHRFAIHAHTNRGPIKLQRWDHKVDNFVNRYFAPLKTSCGVEASKSIFGKKYLQQNKIMHIPNSIDQDVYFNSLKDSEKKQLKSKVFGSENKDKILIGHIGRFNRLKNHPFMLDIIEELINEDVQFKWIFFGSGLLEEKIKKEAENRGLSQDIIFYGRSNQINNMLEILDIFTLPSLQEGLPTVAIESQAKGTPVILSDTISNECDMDLELTEFLPIDNKGKKLWVQKIKNIGKKESIPTIEERKEKLKEKKFTNKEAANLYEEYINDEISYYTFK